MKIYCDTPVKGFGGFSTEEAFRAALAKHPNLRPCAVWNGWAEKKTCVFCKHCTRVDYEEGEKQECVAKGKNGGRAEKQLKLSTMKRNACAFCGAWVFYGNDVHHGRCLQEGSSCLWAEIYTH